ncbi:acyltransferase domain-containing protein [Nakamurella sp.]|uniref:acyltransferase domain-containing protein n=1 Tax=Nakamurella sp. TaxID=1869182 RepID=UPI003B3B197A
MSESTRRVYLFPGQGAYLPGAMAAFAHHPGVRSVLDEIDRTVPPTGAGVTELLLAAGGRPLAELLAAEPVGLQLALFGTSVALFGEIAGTVGDADVLMGHSLGEIAALTAAGALTVADGARIVAARTARLTAAAPPDGGMLALAAGADVAAGLVAAADDPGVVVAVRNAPRQTVLSGPRPGLARIAAAASALGVGATVLGSPFAFHHPALGAAAAAFRTAVAGVIVHPLRHRVHSPILGRDYRDGDDLAALLAHHLVRPVDLVSAVRRLHEHGHTVWVECGARDALGSAVRRTVPGVRTLSCLDGSRPGPDLVGAVREQLTGTAGPSVTLPVVGTVGPVDDAPGPVPGAPLALVADPPALVADPPAPRGPAPAPAANRAELIARLRATYAAALDYPAAVFTEDADLEADLGVDSVKQTELLARVSDECGVAVTGADLGLAELSTLGRIADAVLASGPLTPGAVAPAGPTVPPAPGWPAGAADRPAAADRPVTADRNALLADLRRTYAGALDYPESVFTETADLEADLGIDSVKQTELLARVSEQLPGGAAGRDVPLADLATLGAIADFMLRAGTGLGTVTVAERS